MDEGVKHAPRSPRKSGLSLLQIVKARGCAVLSTNISFSVEATKLDATQELQAAGRCLLLLKALPIPVPVSLPSLCL